MPKVSFIVAVYNSMPYLKQCLDSLRAQTIKDIEIICVNDCSPDNSIDYIESCAAEDPRIKYTTHETNKRQGGAWNTGVRMATGEYLCFVDADDWLEKDYSEVLNEYDADILCAKKWFMGNKESYNIDPDDLARYGNDLRTTILMMGCSFITNFYKRSFIKDISFSFIENNMYQDFMTFTLYFRTDNIIVIDKVGYHYRVDNNSITRSMNQSGFWGRLDVAKKEFETYKELPLFINYQDAIECHFYFLFCRNSLITSFFRFTELPKGIIKKIKDETYEIVPKIRKNPYYKDRFYKKTTKYCLPIHIFEKCPLFVFLLTHRLYILCSYKLHLFSIIRKIIKR